jgi:hypothetical protein
MQLQSSMQQANYGILSGAKTAPSSQNWRKNTLGTHTDAGNFDTCNSLLADHSLMSVLYLLRSPHQAAEYLDTARVAESWRRRPPASKVGLESEVSGEKLIRRGALQRTICGSKSL